MPDPQSLAEVIQYLERTGASLTAEVEASARWVNARAPGEWSVGQIVRHLVRTEQVMYPLWTLVPRLGPRVVGGLDRINRTLWHFAGLRTLEAPARPIRPGDAEAGRFEAPFFLTPSERAVTVTEILAERGVVRARTLRVLRKADPELLVALRWSHPLLGSFSLLGMAEFLGIHEEHHIPQIRRIYERESQ